MRARIEFERERDKARWEAERIDKTQQTQGNREDHQNKTQAELHRAEWEQERDRHEFEAKLEVIRELAKHGHLDSVNLRLDHVVNDVLGSRATPQVEKSKSEDRPALEPFDDERVRVDD